MESSSFYNFVFEISKNYENFKFLCLFCLFRFVVFAVNVAFSAVIIKIIGWLDTKMMVLMLIDLTQMSLISSSPQITAIYRRIAYQIFPLFFPLTH